MSQRFLSLSMLGVMALALAPLASAQGLGQDLSDEERQAIRAELEECRDNNEDHEDKRACAEAVFEKFGIEKPEHGPRGPRGEGEGFGADIPEEAREALKACHENNEEHEDKRTCAEAVAEQYDFELPEHGPRGRGRKIGHMFRSNIDEACGEREDTDEWKECARESRRGSMGELREDHPRAARGFMMRRRFKNLDEEDREALKACRELDTREEKMECFDAVRDQIDSE